MPEDWRTINANGRVITLEVGGEIDECDQFRVALSIDGKTHWEAWITNKSDRLSGEACPECGGRGSGTSFAGCGSCGRIEVAADA